MGLGEFGCFERLGRFACFRGFSGALGGFDFCNLLILVVSDFGFWILGGFVDFRVFLLVVYFGFGFGFVCVFCRFTGFRVFFNFDI